MLIYILAGLAAVIVIFLLVAALQPADFRIVRSALISAPPAVLFARVDNLHTWQEFSPWAKLDPNVRNTYEGPDAGVGASFTWSGNAKAGAGRMTIARNPFLHALACVRRLRRREGREGCARVFRQPSQWFSD